MDSTTIDDAERVRRIRESGLLDALESWYQRRARVGDHGDIDRRLFEACERLRLMGGVDERCPECGTLMFDVADPHTVARDFRGIKYCGDCARELEAADDGIDEGGGDARH